MAQLIKAEYLGKYRQLFADNEFQRITEATFRQWAQDTADSFLGADEAPATAPLDMSTLVRKTVVRPGFNADQPITFGQDTDFDGQTTGFDGDGSLAAFSFEGAVRGATVRVEYKPDAPISFPPNFRILSGNAATVGIWNIIYFRFVRANGVVDVTIS